MNVHMWDIKHKYWIYIDNVKFIVMLDNETFKLDDKEFCTDDYELNFIHSDGA